MPMEQEFIFSKSFINGEWRSQGDLFFEVRNPFDGSLVSRVNDSDVELAEQAIQAATHSYSSWKKKAAKERGQYLQKMFLLMQEHKEALAKIMTLESGKPIQESRSEVDYAASFLQWFGEEAKRNYGDVIPGFSSDRRVMVVKEPIGVVAILTPWNFPLAMITRKLGPALATGCTAVIRQSSKTPLSSLALARIAELAGLPKGVVNVLVGTRSDELGKILCEDSRIAKLSFTGSTQVGQLLNTQCAPGLKKVSLELGGNAPFLVFPDADLTKAVEGAVAAKFRFAGQTCVCVNRILVHEEVYDAFIERFADAVSKLRKGNGMDEETQIGPLIDEKAIQHCQALLEDALQKGGKVITGGNSDSTRFFTPTVLGNANPSMRVAQEEIFGPLAPVFKFSTDEEAINMANDTPFGLAAYYYTENLKRSWKVLEALEYGIVGVNEGIISSETVPFGGVKFSGFGREGSKYGMQDYQTIKYICYGGIEE